MIYIYLEMPLNDVWSLSIDDMEDGHHLFLKGTLTQSYVT